MTACFLTHVEICHGPGMANVPKPRQDRATATDCPVLGIGPQSSRGQRHSKDLQSTSTSMKEKSSRTVSLSKCSLGSADPELARGVALPQPALPQPIMSRMQHWPSNARFSSRTSGFHEAPVAESTLPRRWSHQEVRARPQQTRITETEGQRERERKNVDAEVLVSRRCQSIL